MRVVAILSVTLLIAACGASGQTKRNGTAKTNVAAANAQTYGAQGGGNGTDPTGRPGHRHKTSSSHKSGAHTAATGGHTALPTSLEQAVRDSLLRLPPAKRAQVVGQAVGGALAVYGLRASSVSVTNNATSVVAAISPSTACTATGNVGAIESRILKAAPIVTSLQLTVAGTGESLSQYTDTGCPHLSLPSGPGAVVLTQSGTGVVMSATFTVRSPRWTIAYVNQGGLLIVFPMKGSEPTNGGALVVKSRGAGQQVERGAGTFRLRIGNGTSAWSIQVRDGAR